MRQIKRAIHLDFHTMPGIDDFGQDFDAEEFAKTLSEAGVDYINVFARCNIGYSYYKTKIGVPYPGMKGDMLGEMTEALHRRGIGLSAYINAGLHHLRALENRHWCKVNADGQVMQENRMDNFFRTMCYQTGYGEYLMAEVEEVIGGYDVDGIFLDCINDKPCYGYECLQPMSRAGLDIADPASVRRFAQQANVDYFTRLRGLVPKDKLFFLNSLLMAECMPLQSHAEIECLPTGGWGYDSLPSSAHYVRGFGKTTLNMTGRFHKSWADFGGIRTRDSLCHDLYYGLANGLIPSVGDHMHPRGRLEKPVYDLIGDIYKELAALDPWTDGAAPVTEAAIAVPVGFYDRPANRPGVKGAARMLDELKIQYDIADFRWDLSKYKLLILPDTVLVDDFIAAKLTAFLDAGGRIVSTGKSGLDPGLTGFRLPQWDFDYDGPDPNNVSFFRAGAPFNRNMVDMDIAAYSTGIALKARNDEQVGARLVPPYHNFHWDGFQGYFYVPPKAPGMHAAICRTGQVVQVSFPIFEAYYETAYPMHKQLMGNILDELLCDPLVRVDNLPSFGRVFLTRKDGLIIAHVLCYCPEVRGKHQLIEDAATAADVTLQVQAGNVTGAYTAPSGAPLAFEKQGPYTQVRLPVVKGYQMVVFETSPPAH